MNESNSNKMKTSFKKKNKYVRKSTRKSKNKNVRKLTRKSKNKNVRKTTRKSKKKNVRKSTRKTIKSSPSSIENQEGGLIWSSNPDTERNIDLSTKDNEWPSDDLREKPILKLLKRNEREFLKRKTELNERYFLKEITRSGGNRIYKVTYSPPTNEGESPSDEIITLQSIDTSSDKWVDVHFPENTNHSNEAQLLAAHGRNTADWDLGKYLLEIGMFDDKDKLLFNMDSTNKTISKKVKGTNWYGSKKDAGNLISKGYNLKIEEIEISDNPLVSSRQMIYPINNSPIICN